MKDWRERIDQLDVGFWRLPDQVVRLLFLFVVAITALIVVRCQFVPESFGDEGHYRADSRKAIAALPIKYAGWQTCVECHDEQGEAKRVSYHRTLSCEMCHGPSAAHAQARMESEEEPLALRPRKPSERDECLTCHGYLSSRPTGFPQVIELLHNPMKRCSECHDPHDPTPSNVPESCTACHGQIARTKAVSHHSRVACVVCHDAPEAHRSQPRQNLPKKPSTREFCGKCHAEGVTPPAELKLPGGIPRVEMNDHGGTYMCWQCHYPHFPEGGR